MPWLLERLWLPIFQLSELVGKRSQSHVTAAENQNQSIWYDGRALAHAFMANTTRRNFRFSMQMHMTVQLRWLERQYGELGRLSEAVAAALSDAGNGGGGGDGEAVRRAEIVVRLFGPKRFAPPPESELFRLSAPGLAADRLRRDLAKLANISIARDGSGGGGGSSNGGGGSGDGDGGVAGGGPGGGLSGGGSGGVRSVVRVLQRLTLVAREAQRSIHMIDVSGRTALEELANPVPNSIPPEEAIGSRGRAGEGSHIDRASGHAGTIKAVTDWARRICAVVKQATTSLVCEWPIS